MFRDYYKILNLSRTATKEEIKKAYRKLALEWHPDKNKSAEAHSKFIEINEAYLLLYDNDARTKYNQEYDEYYLKSEPFKTTETKETAFKDENLNKWSRNARQQAEKYATISFEEFAKMIGVVIKEVGNQSMTAVIYAISGVVSASALFTLIEGVRYGDYPQIFLAVILILGCFIGFSYTSKKYK
jgi:curved DNA-binding protein CbpA